MLFLQTYWWAFLILTTALLSGAVVAYLRCLCQLGSRDVFEDFTMETMLRSFLPSAVFCVAGSLSGLLFLIGVVLAIINYATG